MKTKLYAKRCRLMNELISLENELDRQPVESKRKLLKARIDLISKEITDNMNKSVNLN